jgi:hypothetical protein
MYANAKRDAMVGGSQGVLKGLLYSGFNILLFFFAYAKGFWGLGFLRLFWEILFLVSCVSWLEKVCFTMKFWQGIRVYFIFCSI